MSIDQQPPANPVDQSRVDTDELEALLFERETERHGGIPAEAENAAIEVDFSAVELPEPELAPAAPDELFLESARNRQTDEGMPAELPNRYDEIEELLGIRQFAAELSERINQGYAQLGRVVDDYRELATKQIDQTTGDLHTLKGTVLKIIGLLDYIDYSIPYLERQIRFDSSTLDKLSERYEEITGLIKGFNDTRDELLGRSAQATEQIVVLEDADTDRSVDTPSRLESLMRARDAANLELGGLEQQLLEYQKEQRRIENKIAPLVITIQNNKAILAKYKTERPEILYTLEGFVNQHDDVLGLVGSVAEAAQVDASSAGADLKNKPAYSLMDVLSDIREKSTRLIDLNGRLAAEYVIGEVEGTPEIHLPVDNDQHRSFFEMLERRAQLFAAGELPQDTVAHRNSEELKRGVVVVNAINRQLEFVLAPLRHQLNEQTAPELLQALQGRAAAITKSLEAYQTASETAADDLLSHIAKGLEINALKIRGLETNIPLIDQDIQDLSAQLDQAISNRNDVRDKGVAPLAARISERREFIEGRKQELKQIAEQTRAEKRRIVEEAEDAHAVGDYEMMLADEVFTSGGTAVAYDEDPTYKAATESLQQLLADKDEKDAELRAREEQIAELSIRMDELQDRIREKLAELENAKNELLHHIVSHPDVLKAKGSLAVTKEALRQYSQNETELFGYEILPAEPQAAATIEVTQDLPMGEPDSRATIEYDGPEMGPVGVEGENRPRVSTIGARLLGSLNRLTDGGRV